MKRLKEWFIGLSKIGKASVIGVLLFGAMSASGMSHPSTDGQQSVGDSAITNAEQAKIPVVTHQTITETKPVAYERQIVEDANLAKGTTVVRTAGQDGVITVTHNLTLTDGKETNRETSEEQTTAPITEVTAIGTYVTPEPACDKNYSGCVPVVSYDLDCPDIGFSVVVYGYDRHGFDRDHDGYGCESY